MIIPLRNIVEPLIELPPSLNHSFRNTGDLMPRNPDGSIMNSEVHYCDTWKAMEALVDQGLCRAIGLSNFNHKQVLDVIGMARIKPAVLQVYIIMTPR